MRTRTIKSYDLTTATPIKTDVPIAAKRVVVAMSGGVDSSVSALLLQRSGYEVIGATFRFHDRADQAIADAAAICRQLDIPHRVIDLRSRFAEAVILPFVTDYLSGRTPNPCVFCNPELKFKTLLDLAEQEKADHIATGHYIRVVRHPETGRLAITRMGVGKKDQSYFLYRLTQEQLGKLLLPLAGMEKPQVRILAREAGLTLAQNRLSADQPDSQDICFIDDDYVPFIRDYVKNRPDLQEHLVRMDQTGSVIDLNGCNIGTHDGLIHYTPGQRRGFANRTIDRLYVLRSEPQQNTLIVGSKEQICVDRFIIENLVFSGHEAVDAAIRLDCRIRNTAAAVAGKVSPSGDGKYLVSLEKPVHAPAAGQSAVFYDQGIIAFGGIISGLSQ